MILLLDNYDSFTYNLAQFLGQLGGKLEVRRNDQITLDQIAAKKPERIVISPGPGTPEDSGVCGGVVRRFGGTRPKGSSSARRKLCTARPAAFITTTKQSSRICRRILSPRAITR